VRDISHLQILFMRCYEFLWLGNIGFVVLGNFTIFYDIYSVPFAELSGVQALVRRSCILRKELLNASASERIQYVLSYLICM